MAAHIPPLGIWTGLLYSSNQISSQQDRERCATAARVTAVSSAVNAFSLSSLPDDLILEILKGLHVKDINSLSKTNRRFRHLSRSPTVWVSQARTHLTNSCPLILPRNITHNILNFRNGFLTDIAYPDLRNAVLTTAKFCDALTNKRISVAQPQSGTCFRGNLLRLNSTIVHIIPQCALVLCNDSITGRGAQELVGHHVGSDRRENVALSGALFSMRHDQTLESCFCVAGTCPDGPRDMFRFTLTCVQIRHYQTPISSSTLGTNAVNDIWNDENASVPIRAINTNPFLTKKTLACFDMPYSIEKDVRILDTSARMVAVLFECRKGPRKREPFGGCEPASTLGLVIIFNWKTRESVIVDTGIPFNHRNTSVSLHLTPSCSHLCIRTEANIVDCAGANGVDIANSTPEEERSVRRVRTKLLALDRVKPRAKSWEEAIEETWKVVKDGDGGVKWVVNGKVVRKMNEVDELAGVWGTSTQVDYGWDDGVLRAVLGRTLEPSKEKAVSTSATHLPSTHPHNHTASSPGNLPSSSDILTLASLLHMEGSEMIRTWVQHEDWPLFRGERNRVEAGAHSLVSTASLYSVTPRWSAARAGANKAWYLVQSYVGAHEKATSVDTVATNTVVSYPPPIIVPLLNPILVESAVHTACNPRAAMEPLMTVSFNYVVWVDESPVEDLSPEKPWAYKVAKKSAMLTMLQHLGRRSWIPSATGPIKQNKVRKLRLASFRGLEGARLNPSSIPSASSSQFSIANVSTLDVPEDILQRTRQLLLDELEATVTVVCDDGDVYLYSIVQR